MGDTVSVLLLEIAVSHTPSPNVTKIHREKTILFKAVNTTFPVKGNLKATLCGVTWPGISWVVFLE